MTKDNSIKHPKYYPGDVIISKKLHLYVISEVHIVLDARGTQYRYITNGTMPGSYFLEGDIKGKVKVEEIVD